MVTPDVRRDESSFEEYVKTIKYTVPSTRIFFASHVRRLNGELKIIAVWVEILRIVC